MPPLHRGIMATQTIKNTLNFIQAHVTESSFRGGNGHGDDGDDDDGVNFYDDGKFSKLAHHAPPLANTQQIDKQAQVLRTSVDFYEVIAC